MKTIFFSLAVLLLSACAGVDVSEYQAGRPTLDLATYFNGTVDGWGMVRDRAGRVTRRFVVVIDAHWHDGEGVLDEHFVWSDGKHESRIWKIHKDGDRYTGTAGDVVGLASGAASGNALHWRYVLDLPVDARTYHVDMDDWMYLIDAQTLGNQTRISKFGFHLADTLIFFRKR